MPGGTFLSETDIFLSYNREDQAVAKDAFNPEFAHNPPDLTENG